VADLTKLQDFAGEAKGKGTAKEDVTKIAVRKVTWSSILRS